MESITVVLEFKKGSLRRWYLSWNPEDKLTKWAEMIQTEVKACVQSQKEEKRQLSIPYNYNADREGEWSEDWKPDKR